MTPPKQPIDLAVGESVDPNQFSPNSNDPDRDKENRENVEVSDPKDADPNPDPTVGDSQIITANLSAS